MRSFVCVLTLWLWTCAVEAQLAPDAGAESPLPTEPSLPHADAPDGATDDASEAAPDAGANTEPEPPPAERGDKPITAEEIIGEPAPAEAPSAPSEREPEKPPREKPPQEKPAPQRPEKEPGPRAPEPPPGPLVVWATAEWGSALGRAGCGAEGLEGAESALRVASALEGSTAVGGLGLATAGALSDHPLLAYAAEERPEQLAALLASAGFSALALGMSDLAGPLFRAPRLSEALARHGIAVLAANLVCGGEAYCDRWHTAEDPVPVLERRGRRYALVSLLPDDTLGRVQPALGERLTLQPADESMTRRLAETQRAGADLIVAVVDHGPDATASAQLANFVRELPTETRPDILLSPSAGESLLFLRPLDVQPAIVGTRRDVLTGVRVTRLEDRDADVLARSVRLGSVSERISAQLSALGRDFCEARGAPLRGGTLDRPLDPDGLVQLAGAAVRQLAHADLALLDPRTFAPGLGFAAGERLQRAQLASAVPFDSPLVVARVTLDWLNALRGQLAGPRPLTLIGVEQERNDTLIAGRLAVPFARYRIVTSAVLVRAQRLPPGADWEPLEEPRASVRGALETLLEPPSSVDPRMRLHDPLLGTQWLVRMDAQVQANLTATRSSPEYDDAALQADDSRQLGGRLVLNADSDAPSYLFENVVQVQFDRNFVTDTTAQDLTFVQTTYTYRGLWPKTLFYPHPFAEGYLETAFLQPADAAYHHFLLRPRGGVRSIFTRVLSLKLAAGIQYEVFDPDHRVKPGLSGELLLKPWTFAAKVGTLQLEGNVIYYWDSPGRIDDHMLRGQLIGSYTIVGPLQVTLSALGVIRKLPGVIRGQGLTMQLGIRVRFVSRAMID
ncbi:MAG TPA: hypothetical protein VFZ61_11110 [Polyangiales bacterium]